MLEPTKSAHYSGTRNAERSTRNGTGRATSDRTGGSPAWQVPLLRTPQTEAARRELREHIPTLGSVERIVLTMNGGVIPNLDGTGTFRVLPDPAHQVQTLLRHRQGWGWTCGSCHREIEGCPEVRPAKCPSCKSIHLLGGKMPLYFLAEFTGGGNGYDGGIESVNLICSFGWWCKAVGQWRVFRAIDGYVLRESLRVTARAVERSHEWVRTAVACVRDEWERE